MKIVPKDIQTLEVLNKDFKSAIINMFKILKERSLTNKGRYEHNVSPSREYRYGDINQIFKSQVEILEMKSTILKQKLHWRGSTTDMSF